MIGETALSTRTKCDECRVRTATRETAAGVFCEMCEPLTAANDDVLGTIFTAHPHCSRCQIRPAMLRVDPQRCLCSECWRQLDAKLSDFNSSFLVTATPRNNATTDTGPLPAAAPPVSVVATLSRIGASRSCETKEGGEIEAHQHHLITNCRRRPESGTNFGFENAKESPHDMEVRIGAAGKGPRLSLPERGRAAASDTADQIFSSGDGLGIHQPRSIEQGRARDRAICPAVSGNISCGGGESRPASGFAQSLHTGDVEAGIASGPQDSTPALPQGGSPVTVGRLVPAPAVTPIFDLETDRLVSGLEVGWALERKKFGASFANPIFIGADLATGPDRCVGYDPTTQTFVDIGTDPKSEAAGA